MVPRVLDKPALLNVAVTVRVYVFDPLPPPPPPPPPPPEPHETAESKKRARTTIDKSAGSLRRRKLERNPSGKSTATVSSCFAENLDGGSTRSEERRVGKECRS